MAENNGFSDEELLRRNAEQSKRILGEIGSPDNIRRMVPKNGKAPFAKRPNESGEIRFSVRVEGDLLIMDFGTPVAWFGLEAEQLGELIKSLRKHYKKMKK